MINPLQSVIPCQNVRAKGYAGHDGIYNLYYGFILGLDANRNTDWIGFIRSIRSAESYREKV